MMNIRCLVGNIPYGVTEDQLKDIFGEAGSVVSFRLDEFWHLTWVM